MNDDQLHELLYQALETELGGVQIYEAALRCVQNDDLHEEWEKYLGQTRHHVELVEGALRAFGLDPTSNSRDAGVVRHIGESLVEVMQVALARDLPEAAQLVAAECVTLAETKDHLNWELIGEVVKHLKGDARQGRCAPLRRSRRTRGRAPLPHHGLGPASCGSRHSACPRCCRRLRSKRMSRLRSARPEPSRSEQT